MLVHVAAGIALTPRDCDFACVVWVMMFSPLPFGTATHLIPHMTFRLLKAHATSCSIPLPLTQPSACYHILPWPTNKRTMLGWHTLLQHERLYLWRRFGT